MALTPEQTKALLDAKAKGLSKEQAMASVFTKPTQTQRPVGRLADIPSDLMQTGTELFKGLATRYSDVRSVTEPSSLISRYRQYGGGISGAGKTLGEAGLVAGGNLVGAGFDVASSPFMAAGRAYLSPQEEEKTASLFQKGLQATGLPQQYQEMTPEGQRNTRAGLGLLDILGLKGAGRASTLFTKTPKVETPTIRPSVTPTKPTSPTPTTLRAAVEVPMPVIVPGVVPS